MHCRCIIDVCIDDWLVVEPYPLNNMTSSIGMIIPNIWKNKKCSKPPTSYRWLRMALSCQVHKRLVLPLCFLCGCDQKSCPIPPTGISSFSQYSNPKKGREMQDPSDDFHVSASIFLEDFQTP